MMYMKCFFLFIRNRISCFQKKMVQYPVEWNFTSNETEPAAEWRFNTYAESKDKRFN